MEKKSRNTNSSCLDAENEEMNRFKEFCTSVSAHGYCHMVKGSAVSRAVWTIVLVVGFFCAIFHLQGIAIIYLKYDYYEVVTVNPDAKRIFPDITICDNAKISEYAVLESQEIRDIAHYFFSTNDTLRMLINSTNQKITFSAGTLYLQASMPSGQLTLLGSRFNSLVVDCIVNQQTCNRENFELHVNPIYVNCYTFKAETVKNNFNSVPEPELGLSLILRGETAVNVYYYELSKTDNIKGIHVDIHPSNTMPFSENRGIDLTPGTSTSVGLGQKMYSRLGTPYDDCEPTRNITLLSKEYPISPNICLFQCAFKYVREQCDCTSVLLGVTDDSEDYCSYVELGHESKTDVNISKVLCEINETTFLKNNVDKLCKRCAWNCEEIKYDMKISQAQWPQEAAVEDFINKFVLSKEKDNPVRRYYEHLLQTLALNKSKRQNSTKEKQVTLIDLGNKLSSGFKDWNDETAYWENVPVSPYIPDSLRKSNSVAELQRKWVQESFYRLNVFFSEPYVTTYRQVASLSFGDFLSGVGGVLGIWAGASVLTLLEILSFFGGLVSKKSLKIKHSAEMNTGKK